MSHLQYVCQQLLECTSAGLVRCRAGGILGVACSHEYAATADSTLTPDILKGGCECIRFRGRVGHTTDAAGGPQYVAVPKALSAAKTVQQKAIFLLREKHN